ncbi:hypothetical protein JOM56_013001 [Amanita muscaria]
MTFLETFLQQEQAGEGGGSNPFEDDHTSAGHGERDSDEEEERDSPEPPPSTQLPYRTTGIISFMAPFSPRTVRTIKSFGKRTCQEMELAEDSLDDFTKLPNIPYMLIHVMAALKKFNRTDTANETKKLLESHEFRTVLSERLMTFLLSPQLTAYRKGLANHAVDFIAKNKPLFKVPNEVYEDPEMRALFSTLVRELLTQHRSNIKQRINRGINQAMPIVELSRLIAPSSIELTLAHMARIAFLRITYQECMAASTPTAPVPGNELGSTSEAGNSSASDHSGSSSIHPSRFWEVVDDRIMQIRKAAAASTNPNFVTKYFTSALQNDFKKFPSPDRQPPAPSRVSGEEWQKIIEKGGCFEAEDD